MKQAYEIAVLYHPSLEVDLDKAEAQVKKIVADNDGEIVEADNWGKRKLAYPIKKQDHAVYVFYRVNLPAESVGKVESTLNITDEVIRFLITKIDPKAEAVKKVAAKVSKLRETSGDGDADDKPARNFASKVSEGKIESNENDK